MARTREELFGVLVREHELGLLAFVRACVHDAADADDLVQETFVTAWQQLEKYDHARPFAGWVRGIAKHKILAYFRSSASARRHLRLLSPDSVEAVANEFEQFSQPPRGEVYRDCFAALRACLETLAKDDREIVRRVYEDNESCRIISDQLGKTVDSIRKHLQRARAQLRECVLGKLKLETTNG
jgi:RNA polymerase sigma-70 factor (ECF subfamily)